MRLVGGPVLALFMVGCVLMAGQACSQEGAHLPPVSTVRLPDAPKPTLKYPGNDLAGIGANDQRTTVDQTQMPWRAIGRVQLPGASCTGALVAPKVLLTAAHCVFSAQTRQLIPAHSLHFLLAYSEGKYTADAFGTRITVSKDYDPVLAIGTMGDDWALVELDRPIGQPNNFLPITLRSPSVGDDVALGGYAKDHPEILMVDLHCHVLGVMLDRKGMPLIRHDCSATHGVSGAPLLMRNSGGWEIGGIEVVESANAGGGASVLYEVAQAMAQSGK
jgi:protease YdgD